MRSSALLLACALPLSAAAAEMRFTGQAMPLNGDNLLYEEQHVVTGKCTDGLFRPASHNVTYVRSNGEPFAEKTLSYEQSTLRPAMTFRQPGFNEVMEIRNRDDATLEIEWQTPEGDTENSTVEVTRKLVADAGFDNLVRNHWPEVTSGDRIEFNFLAPTRGKAYGFVLEPAKDDRINATHTVLIEPSSTILSFLVDPILLGYNDNGALTDYLGLTNIRKDQDSNYTAHIRYAVDTAPDCELTR